MFGVFGQPRPVGADVAAKHEEIDVLLGLGVFLDGRQPIERTGFLIAHGEEPNGFLRLDLRNVEVMRGVR